MVRDLRLVKVLHKSLGTLESSQILFLMARGLGKENPQPHSAPHSCSIFPPLYRAVINSPPSVGFGNALCDRFVPTFLSENGIVIAPFVFLRVALTSSILDLSFSTQLFLFVPADLRPVLYLQHPGSLCGYRLIPEGCLFSDRSNSGGSPRSCYIRLM